MKRAADWLPALLAISVPSLVVAGTHPVAPDLPIEDCVGASCIPMEPTHLEFYTWRTDVPHGYAPDENLENAVAEGAKRYYQWGPVYNSAWGYTWGGRVDRVDPVGWPTYKDHLRTGDYPAFKNFAGGYRNVGGCMVHYSAYYNSNPPSSSTFDDGLNVDVLASFGCRPGYLSGTDDGTGQAGCRPGWDVIKKRHAGPQCGASTDHPISFVNGNKYLVEEDFQGFSRVYNSTNADAVSEKFFNQVRYVETGRGWLGAYRQRLEFQEPVWDLYGVAWSVRPDGKLYTFTNKHSAGWKGDQDVNDTLVPITALGDGTAFFGWRYFDAQRNRFEIYFSDGSLAAEYSLDGKSVKLAKSDGIAGNSGYLLDDNGNATAVAVPQGKLLSATDFQGRMMAFFYDSANRLKKVTRAGVSVVYSYDTQGRLSGVVYPDGSSRSYLYAEAEHVADAASTPNVLTGIEDENGSRYASYSYNAVGDAVREVLGSAADNAALTYQKNSSTNFVTSTQVQDALGASRTYTFAKVLGANLLTGVSQPGGSGCSASSSALTYDVNGNVTSRADFSGRKVCYTNDLTRNLETARIEGFSGSTACPSDVSAATPSATQRKVSTLWHPSWRLEVRRAEPKLITSWIYNGQTDPTNNNAVASCAPSSATLPDGQPIAVLCKKVEQATTDETGASGFSAIASGSARIWTYSYNPYGQVLSAAGPRSADRVTYSYYSDTSFDSTGVGHTLGDLASQTNALGDVTTYDKYDKSGRLLEKTEADGVKTTQSWHVRGWLTSVTRSAGAQAETSVFDYDKVGQLTRTTQPDGSWVAYTYDAAHRLTDVSDSRGDSVHYTLDAMGNRSAEDWKDQGGVLRRSITRSYDALNRLQSVNGAAQ